MVSWGFAKHGFLFCHYHLSWHSRTGPWVYWMQKLNLQIFVLSSYTCQQKREKGYQRPWGIPLKLDRKLCHTCVMWSPLIYHSALCEGGAFVGFNGRGLSVHLWDTAELMARVKAQVSQMMAHLSFDTWSSSQRITPHVGDACHYPKHCRLGTSASN